MKRTQGPLIALSIIVTGVVAILLGIKLYLPGYVEARVVAEAKARGIELQPGKIGFGWQWVQLQGATAKLIGAPSFEAKLGLVDLQLQNFQPKLIEVSDVKAAVSGSLPRVVLELGEWTKDHPDAFAAPLVASRVTVMVSEAPARAPWLELSGGFLTRTVAGAAFSASSCKLSGLELGKVGAGYSLTGGDVSIGFGDQSAQAAPLRIDASVGSSGGSMKVSLAPTKIGLLGKSLGILVPLPEVEISSQAELTFPAALAGEIKGKLNTSLRGFVPPHPPELDGFVFGDVTTFESDFSVDAARTRVTLSESTVKAGRFELKGGGRVAREGLDALARFDFKGALPCDALAGAAAESRLGQLLGRASAKQGKRTALAVVRGTVSVDVAIDARASDLPNAKVTQKIGIGCGLRPLTLGELLELTPNAKDLQAIGDEVGRKLEGIGKDLGLPPIPPELKLPSLPLPDLAPPKSPKKKELAPPAPSR